MIPNHFIEELIKQDDPVELIWDKLVDIWKPEKDIKKHYEKEILLVNFEEILNSVYDEFFSEILPRKCIKNHLDFNQETCFIFMDGMSIREGTLICDKLKKMNYDVNLSYSFSSLPSSTDKFREKINFNDLRKNNSIEISNHEHILLSGDEKIIWSRYPDVFFDKIRVGSTVLDSLENKYNITEKVLLELLKQLDSSKIVITSDHGYVRTEASYNFRVSSDVKKRIKECFGNKRAVSMDEMDAEILVKNGYAIAFNGYYILKSRYISTGTGQYITYLHDGVSLMECFTPKIIIS